LYLSQGEEIKKSQATRKKVGTADITKRGTPGIGEITARVRGIVGKEKWKRYAAERKTMGDMLEDDTGVFL